jgi:hypothetical protein
MDAFVPPHPPHHLNGVGTYEQNPNLNMHSVPSAVLLLY